MSNAIYCYDFTSFAVEGWAHTDVAKRLARYSKKFVFQKEKTPTTGREHWQGRLSLSVKRRLGEIKELFDGPLAKAHWTPTSQRGKATFEYVMKEDTRLEGPWTDANWQPPVMPEELKELKALKPWQQFVVDDCKAEKEVKRIINVIVDHTGGQGKGFLRKYLRFHNIARPIPTTTKVETIMAWGMKFPARAYVLDMPRGTGMKKDVIEMWRGLESLKDGSVYETRYTPQDQQLQFSPHIWVMTNELPDERYLSHDRWQVWLIDPTDDTMLPYDAGAAENIRKFVEAKKAHEEAEKKKRAAQRAMHEKVAKWAKNPPVFKPPVPSPQAHAFPVTRLDLQ